MSPDLVQALLAGATIITPNRRFALFIKNEYDAAQVRSGKSVWPSADALPYGAFLERTWQDLALAENGALLLSPQQETALWETVIEASRYASLLLNPTAAARTARDAWITQHAFGMDHLQHRPAWESTNEDVAAFNDWRRAYAERLRSAGWIDSAQLPQAIVDALNAGAQPRVRPSAQIVRAGFDVYTPQQQSVFAALAQAGCVIVDAPASVVSACAVLRRACNDAEAELNYAAACVREWLASHAAALPHLRVGVVVPDLAARRTTVMRVFGDVLDPQSVALPSEPASRLFNCSLGLPLTSYPLVMTAFLLLKLASGEATLEEAGALLRSPHIGGADDEFASRALVDAQLRARGRKRVTLGALLQVASDRAPRLAALAEPWIARVRDARRLRQAPSAWSATFLSLLKAFGWPGERTLDSAEFQTFEKFRDAISSLSVLDPLRPHLTLAEALSALRRLAADTVFQPEAADAPVQILGTLESTGLSFDALFVTGLAGETWPAAPRPNPFLPGALQRALGVPHASAEWELQFARRMTDAWRQAAPAVMFTWPQRDGERELTRSPLIDDVPESSAITAAAASQRVHDALFDARAFEVMDDWRAPLLCAPARVSGGAQMFQNQAACPFRSYAVHRLGARGLEDGTDGLDPRERGSLVHQALTELWRDIGSQANLLAFDESVLRQKTENAANAAVDTLCRVRPDLMTDAFAALERERLNHLLLRLTALEKSRAPFEVVACEQSRAPEIAGVQLNTRLDRLDKLADGSHVILDYKTGLANIGGWLGERPDEPQLPLYAASNDAVVSGVSFVQLRAREVAFKGLTRDADVLPGVGTLAVSKVLSEQYGGWPALLDSWRTVLEQLARDYLTGHAEVTPKRYPKTCEYCDLGALCRVRELTEHAAPGDLDDAQEGDAQ